MAHGLAVVEVPVWGDELPFPHLPSADLLLWLDAARGVYQNTALTIPSTNEGFVAGWKDQSANVYHVTQAGATTVQPIWSRSIASLNNRAGLTFDGGDLLERNVAGIVANLNLYSIYLVLSTSSVVLDQSPYSEGHATLANPIISVRINRTTAGNATHIHRDDAGTIAIPQGAAAVNDGTAKLMTIRRIASNSWSVRVNGVEKATSTIAPTTTTISKIAIGQCFNTGYGNPFIGNLAQVVAYGSDNYATVEPVLASFYNITLP